MGTNYKYLSHEDHMTIQLSFEQGGRLASATAIRVKRGEHRHAFGTDAAKEVPSALSIVTRVRPTTIWR